MTQEELLEAVQYGDYERVNFGLEQGLNPNYVANESGGYTLIHWSSQEGYAKIIELLAQHGADVNVIDENDMTPLFNSAGSDDLEVIETLVRCGADVNISSNHGTALHNAAAYGNTKIAEFLISKGANVNAIDDRGHTPLLLALSHEHDGLGEILISHGAIKYVTDDLSENLKIYNMVLDKYDLVGYDQLREVERTLVCVLNLKYEVESQGFRHFYRSTSGYLFKEVIPALGRIGAVHTALLVKRANDLFDGGASFVNAETSNELDTAFFQDEDNLSELLENFVQEYREQLLFR